MIKKTGRNFSNILKRDKAYFRLNEKGEKISFWNDIDYLVNKGIYRMVVEVPSNKIGKFECDLKNEFNPIIQDIKKNPLDSSETIPRFYPMYPLFNYGYIPQTIEDPKVKIHNKYMGDGDPVDVLELSDSPSTIGEVYEVRVLGALPLIDQGEFDCKILAVRVDPNTEIG